MEMNNIEYSQTGAVGRIKLNCPETGNALSIEMLTEMKTLMKRLERQPEVKVLVISGAGRGFCSGFDFDLVIEREEIPISRDILRKKDVLDIFRDIRNCNIITIGQIHGYCLNGALDLCQQFDFNIVADDSMIGIPFNRRVFANITQMLFYNVGPQWAKYMMMTGDTIDGITAEKIGFAIKSVPDNKLERITDFFAERLSMVNRDLLASYKSTVNRAMDLQGCSDMQGITAEAGSIANSAEEVAKDFRRFCLLGIKRVKKDINEGFKPQKAPFEPLED